MLCRNANRCCHHHHYQIMIINFPPYDRRVNMIIKTNLQCRIFLPQCHRRQGLGLALMRGGWGLFNSGGRRFCVNNFSSINLVIPGAREHISYNLVMICDYSCHLQNKTKKQLYILLCLCQFLLQVQEVDSQNL